MKNKKNIHTRMAVNLLLNILTFTDHDDNDDKVRFSFKNFQSQTNKNRQTNKWEKK